MGREHINTSRMGTRKKNSQVRDDVMCVRLASITHSSPSQFMHTFFFKVIDRVFSLFRRVVYLIHHSFFFHMYSFYLSHDTKKFEDNNVRLFLHLGVIPQVNAFRRVSRKRGRGVMTLEHHTNIFSKLLKTPLECSPR